MDRYISVDSGKNGTKVCILRKDHIEKFTFSTRMDEGNMQDVPEANTYIVEYEGKVFKIGDGANKQAPYETTKQSDIHKLSTLMAIALKVDNGDRVNVVIGCPLTIYENVTQRENYKNYMLPEGNVKIKVKIGTNIHEKTFAISKRMVLPEGSGIIYLKMAEFRNKFVGVIDIGGLNMNASIYSKLMLQHNFSVTADMGSNKLCVGLAQALNSAYSTNVSPEWVDHMLKEESKSSRRVKSRHVPEATTESPGFIEKYVKDHVNSILEACTKANWDLMNTDLVFIGGTSALLKDEISEVLNDDVYVPNEAAFINSLGWLKVLCGTFNVALPPINID